MKFDSKRLTMIQQESCLVLVVLSFRLSSGPWGLDGRRKGYKSIHFIERFSLVYSEMVA